jgi:hypothetical protein
MTNRLAFDTRVANFCQSLALRLEVGYGLKRLSLPEMLLFFLGERSALNEVE